MSIPDEVLAAVKAKGLPVALGTDDATLFRKEGWELADYGKVEEFLVHGGPGQGKGDMTNRDCIALLRAVITLKGLVEANPMLVSVVFKLAANPRVVLPNVGG